MPITLFGQLKGTYCHSEVFFGACISFFDSNNFKYSSSDCTSSHIGKGIYKIRRSNLILEFQNDTTQEERSKAYIHKEPTSSDSITISVELYDKFNESLIAATAEIENENIGVVVDFYGCGTFKVPKSLDAKMIVFRYVGYKPYREKILLDSNYNIKVYLSSWSEVYGSKYKWKLKIKDIKPESISLRYNSKRSSYERYNLVK